jgi:hypothetical protein
VHNFNKGKKRVLLIGRKEIGCGVSGSWDDMIYSYNGKDYCGPNRWESINYNIAELNLGRFKCEREVG